MASAFLPFLLTMVEAAELVLRAFEHVPALRRRTRGFSRFTHSLPSSPQSAARVFRAVTRGAGPRRTVARRAERCAGAFAVVLGPCLAAEAITAGASSVSFWSLAIVAS